MYKKSKNNKSSLTLQRPKIELRSRNKVKFKQAFTDKTKVLNSPFYRGMYLWNQLPAYVQNIEEIPAFKTYVKEMIMSGQIKGREKESCII